ncbi:hypothetical protein GGD66_007912 [Bradyrhizobium sp. CIR48]|nr:hypothetical protein [Bradyrhizobium sp. CIR18]MBB4429310.1 hypothetical protein [Bradyrhizobium sp. CIR48]
MLAVTASIPRGRSLSGGPSIIMPPGLMLGPLREFYLYEASVGRDLESPFRA